MFYCKLFASLWRGSMRGKSDLQLVFIYILGNCDPEGFADFVPEVIADDCGMPIERVNAALSALCQPDPKSRSSEQEGRRLVPIDDRDWGWKVVNHEFYKTLRDPDMRREQWRRGQANHRAREKAVNGGQQMSTQTEVDTDTEAEKTIDFSSRNLTPLTGGNAPAEELELTLQQTKANIARARALSTRTKQLTAEFERIWNLYPHHGRRSLRSLSLKRWLALQPRPEIEAVLASINAAMSSPDWRKDGGEYVPGLQVWINSQGWDASNGNGHSNGNGWEHVARLD